MKKTLLIVVAIVLVAALSVGGTFAYLQDTDEDVNVATVGNVKIEQIEQQKNDDGSISAFEQGKDFYPGSELSKIVSVKNTGASDAYFRTLIAFEDVPGSNTFGIGFPISESYTWDWLAPGATFELNGSTYQVYEAVYKKALKPGETSPASLTKVELAETATNEDMEVLGKTYDILVLSQAVQTVNFPDAKTALDEAFGELTDAKAAEWFGGDEFKVPVLAKDAEDVAGAFKDGGKVVLQEDVEAEDYEVAAGKAVEVELNDNELKGGIVNNGELAVKGGTLYSDAFGFENNGKAEITDVDMNSGSPAEYAIRLLAGSETVYNNVNIDSKGGGIGVADGAKAVFNSGSVAVNSASTSGRYNFYLEGAGSELTINGGTFSFSKTLNQKRAYIYAGDGTKVYVTGGTFGPASTRSGYTAGILTAGTGEVIITGGTFGFDPTPWVKDGYQAVKDGSVWTVSAK